MRRNFNVRSLLYPITWTSNNWSQTCTIKAKKINLPHRTLRTSKNVSARLPLSLFDNYQSSILLYGFAIWGMPKLSKLISLIEQPENKNIKTTETRTLTAKCGYFLWKKSSENCATKSWPIVIDLNHIEDSENPRKSYMGPSNIFCAESHWLQTNVAQPFRCRQVSPSRF